MIIYIYKCMYDDVNHPKPPSTHDVSSISSWKLPDLIGAGGPSGAPSKECPARKQEMGSLGELD